MSGELRPGDALPSERELMASLAVGRVTIREAMQNRVETVGTAASSPEDRGAVSTVERVAALAWRPREATKPPETARTAPVLATAPVLVLPELTFCTRHADCTLILRRHDVFGVDLYKPKQGDYWIVYMGNNEVVGPFGAGTVFLQVADAQYLFEPEAKAFQPLPPPTRRLSAAHASDAEPTSCRSCRRKPSIASLHATARSTSGLVPATYAPISMRSFASR